jgi:DNA adenine methylase
MRILLTAATPQLPELAPGPLVRPFLRWAGGKTRLLRTLRAHFPATFHGYYEPFLGGGAVFFDTGRRSTGPIVLSDLNAELVNVWRLVRDQPGELLTALTPYDGKDTEVEYYAVRDGAQPDEPVARAARFLYLNQTAWNGLWRVNRWGRFNVPWGARPFRGVDADELLDLSAVLAHVDIREADFRDVLAEPGDGDFVYLDPPYLPVSDTSKFHGYTERRFRGPDLAELAELCRQLTERGAHWVLSNRDTPLVRELFGHAEILALTTRRSVAAQNRRDVEPADSPEVIIVGGA